MDDCVFLKIAALLTQFIFSKPTIQHAIYFNNQFLCFHGKLPAEAWGTKTLPLYAQEGGSEALGSHRVNTQALWDGHWMSVVVVAMLHERGQKTGQVRCVSH